MNYDGATGNLLSRTHNSLPEETFGYDNLDRLVSVKVGTQETMHIKYADNGNITSKTGIGQYYYSAERPHAVSSVDNTDNLISTQACTTCFNELNKISSIQENGKVMTIDYGPDLERCLSILKQGNTILRKVTYLDDYEKVVANGVTREFYYLDGDVIVIRENGKFQTYQSFNDNLGSILSVVDENGSKVFSAEYDAWGKQTVSVNTIGLIRGYCGHEMLNEFNLINMNGRVYDPVLGRFLSPDKYVQEGDNSQNYNSYSYCLNNPLKYTDPSGNLFGIDDAIIFGVVSGAVFGTINAAMKGDKIWAGALIGGITGGLSGWAGQALSTYAKAGNMWAGALAGAGAGSIVGSVSSFATTGLNNLLNKRCFTDNILKAMWQSALTGAVSGAISGGIESYENCKDNGVNPFTGNHEGSRRTHYPLRNNVDYNLQPDKTKDCYSYALEYTSKQLGHPETAESFINAANGADGADVSKVLNSHRYKGALKNYRLIRLPRDTELEQFTNSFELGRYSSVISLTEHHAVALSQYDTVIRNCWFGGSAHIVMDNIQIFDPLIGIRPFYGNVGAFDIIRVKF